MLIYLLPKTKRMVHIKSHQEFKSIFCFKTNMALYFMQVLALPQRWYTIIFSFGKSTFSPKLFITLNTVWMAENPTPYCKHKTMPWAMSSSLGDNKLFFGPKHNIYALFMILFGLFVCQNLSCELWNRKLKIKEIYLKKILQTQIDLFGSDKHVLILFQC